MNENIVFVMGSDGYIGTALVQRLLASGYSVVGFDSMIRRSCVEQIGGSSYTPIYTSTEKNKILEASGAYRFHNLEIIENFDVIEKLFDQYRPGTIVNLAHQPSGPWSMKDRDHSEFTLFNNIMSTNKFMWMLKEKCPDCHYITVGSTGEYSHEIGVDIQEGYFTFKDGKRKSKESIFPRRPTSLYHASKVSSTYLIDYCTRIWNLKTTDVMQAVVFGMYTDEIDNTKIFTRFDIDECFGTVINRFIAQAIMGQDLTVYGEGKHQRGFLSLNDSVQALMIAIRNVPKAGKSRVWNQLSEWHSINSIAKMIQNVAKRVLEKDVNIKHIPTLRHEFTGEHYYKYVCKILPSLGYKPTRTIEQEIEYCFTNLRNVSIPNVDMTPKIQF